MDEIDIKIVSVSKTEADLKVRNMHAATMKTTPPKTKKVNIILKQ